jgi:hypothetical protein
VPRARRGEGDLRMVGVQVYDEVLVGGVRVHADLGREAPARVRNVLLVSPLVLYAPHYAESTSPVTVFI